jgi:hypothetical protein
MLPETASEGRIRNGARLGTGSPRQIRREPLQGSQQILILDVPEGAAGGILAQHADRSQELAELHFRTKPPDFIQPMEYICLGVNRDHIRSPTLG